MTTVEEERFLRSLLLSFRGSSYIAKEVLRREEQKQIQENARDLDDLLKAYEGKLEHEFKNHTQREILFPSNGNTDIEKWDISLLTGVLKIIFKSSLSTEENEALKKIRYHRNETFAHSATASLSDDDYTRICDELKAAIYTLASGFSVDVKEQCDKHIEACLSGPLDLKYLVEQFKGTSQMSEMIREVVAKTGKQTTDILTTEFAKQCFALEKTILDGLSSKTESILIAIGDSQLKKQDFNNSDQETQTEPLQDKQCTCGLSLRKVKAADEDDMGEVEDEEIQLRDYQKELAGPALDGQNVIIVAPTRSGKKTVAIAVIQEHLRQRKGYGNAKVVFLVNQDALACQIGRACQEHLKQYATKVISGELQRTRKGLQDFIERNDILVVTAPKLLDAVVREEFSISKISLLIVDECHHTHAKHDLNQIMGRYMDLKFGETEIVLPQVVGLTASMGMSKVKNKEKAVEQVQHLMANLDAQVICTVQANIEELRKHVSIPEESSEFWKLNSTDITNILCGIQILEVPKCMNDQENNRSNFMTKKSVRIYESPEFGKIYKVPRRENEEFEPNVVQLMKSLEKKMYRHPLVKDIPESCRRALLEPNTKGTPQYAQWVSTLQQKIAKIKNSEAQRVLKLFTTHLEHYNKALILNDDVGKRHAQTYLEKEMNKGKQDKILDENASLLHGTYERLRRMEIPDCPNPKLNELSDIIQTAYRNNSENARGILLVKTTDVCKAILSWIEETPELRKFNPVHLEDTDMTPDKGGINQAEQIDALHFFRDGAHKLLVTTSDAVEGLDISKCNLVIRYDLVTNEIARIRSIGRTANNNHYVVAEGITEYAGKEELDMICKLMMENVINQMQTYIAKDPKRFHRAIQKLQDEAYRDRQFKGKHIRNGKCRLHCNNCGHFICWSDDIKKIGSHHAIVHVRPRLSRNQDVIFDTFGEFICKMCEKKLGVICAYKTFEFPLLQVKEVSVVDEKGRRNNYKRWSMFPFAVAGLKEKDLKTSIMKNKDTFMM